MKTNLRNLVLLFLKQLPSDKYEQFNKAFELYKQSENKVAFVETKLNRTGYSEDGLQNLLYDLKQLHSISDTDIASTIEVATNDEAVQDSITGIGYNPTNVAKKVLEHTENPDLAPKDFKMVTGEEIGSLRSEFPFLNDKDCPEVLFVVVGKRISAYRRYQALHEQLTEILEGKTTVTPEEQSALAFETQQANAENLALWNELNHYATTGEILGKHSLFKEIVAKREVDAMTMDQLAKYRTSSSTFISKKRTAMKAKGLTAEKKAELEEAIVDREYKLALVNTKLGVDGTK